MSEVRLVRLGLLFIFFIYTPFTVLDLLDFCHTFLSPSLYSSVPIIYHFQSSSLTLLSLPPILVGEVQIALTNAQGQDIPIDIQDNRDGTFTVEYSTSSPGDHRVTVLYAGAEIPQSPIVVPVQSHVDVTKVKVDGLEPSEYRKITVLFLGSLWF